MSELPYIFICTAIGACIAGLVAYVFYRQRLTALLDLTETPARAAMVLTDGIRDFDGASTLDMAALLLHFSEARADFVRRQLVTTVTRFSGRGQYAMDELAKAGILF